MRSQRSQSAQPVCLRRGFSLVELMVVLAITGLLAGMALPAYQGHLRKTRRGDAQGSLQRIQLEQTRWRAQHETYTTSLSDLGLSSNLSAQGYYQLSIAQANNDGFMTQATALADQAKDGDCAFMQLRISQSATVTMSSGAAALNDAARCWKQ